MIASENDKCAAIFEQREKKKIKIKRKNAKTTDPCNPRENSLEGKSEFWADRLPHSTFHHAIGLIVIPIRA
jgi:hypothetical protein